MKLFFDLLLQKCGVQQSVNDYAIHFKHDFDNKYSAFLYAYFMQVIHLIKENKHSELLSVKYQKLENVMSNIFFSNDLKEEFFAIFSQCQKQYIALLHFKRKCMLKKYKIQIDTDLCGNNLNEQNGILLCQDKAQYYFSMSDLIQIFKNALLHTSYSFINEPLVPKNPYTNCPFNNENLYKIYWTLRKSDYKIPIVFHYFYECFFDAEKLLHKYEVVLREYVLQDFLHTSMPSVLVRRIKIMLKEYRIFAPFIIDDKFPDHILISVMKPYLRLFFIQKYSLMRNDEKFNAQSTISYKLKTLYKHNPMFGRVILKRKYTFIKQRRSKFVRHVMCDHIPFHEITLGNNDDDDNDDDEDESSDTDEDVLFRMPLPLSSQNLHENVLRNTDSEVEEEEEEEGEINESSDDDEESYDGPLQP
jgi:hypothetical protein